MDCFYQSTFTYNIMGADHDFSFGLGKAKVPQTLALSFLTVIHT